MNAAALQPGGQAAGAPACCGAAALAAAIVQCLRGRAREHDADAFALLREAGFAPHEIAFALPHARALARAKPGA